MSYATVEDTGAVIELLRAAGTTGLAQDQIASRTGWPLWRVNDALVNGMGQIRNYKAKDKTLSKRAVTKYILLEFRQT